MSRLRLNHRTVTLALMASGLATLTVSGPAPSASAAPAFTVDGDSVVVVHSSTGITGSQNPREVAGDGAVSTLTLAHSSWLLRGGALAPDGTLYLQDASVVPTRVVTITPDGTEGVDATLDFPAAGQLAPTSGDVTMLPDGDLVVSAYRSPNTRFTRVDPSTGATTTLFTLTNSESAPRTAADAAGNLYYFTALGSPKQVWKVSPTVGATPTLVGGTGTLGYDMTVDGAGNVYVAGGVGVSSANHGEIDKLTLQGDGSYSAATVWATTPTVAQGGYAADGGITATSNGQVVLARSDGAGNAALYRFSSAGGTAVATQPVTGVYPQVLTALPSSNPFTDAVDASISGTVSVGTALTGSAGTYAPSDATIAYAWTVGADTVGTTSSYTPKLADAAKTLTLSVTGSKAGYTDSASTTTGQTVATVQGFTGTVKAGQTLTASDTSGTLTWGLSASSSCASPTTATGTTYALPGDSAGKYLQLSQTLSGRTGSGTCVGPIAAATSSPTITGAATAAGLKGETFSYTPTSVGGVPAPTVTALGTLPSGVSVDSSTGALSGTPDEAGVFQVTLMASNGVGSPVLLRVVVTILDVVTGLSPTIIGTPKVGETLTASPGASLVPDASAGATVSYLWQHESAPGAWDNLTGGATYSIVPAEVGRVYRVRATVSKTGFKTRVEYSPTTAPAVNGTFSISAPTISGTVRVGETLTCAAAAGTPGAVSYAWTRGATSVGSGATYELVATDRTQEVTCTVTSVRAGYTDATASADSATVDTGSFTIGAPSITGTAVVGQTLTCAAAPGTMGSVSYAWARGATALGAGATHELTPEDRGRTVTCEATAVLAGYPDATEEVESAAVASGTFTIGVPGLAGEAQVGMTLSCAVPPATPGTVSYAWVRGATMLGSGARYRLTAPDLTQVVTCAVTAVREGYEDATASAASATVQPGQPASYHAVLIGTAKAGRTLRARVDDLPAEATVRWQWFRGRARVLGATGGRYKLPARAVHQQVWAVATIQVPGYDDASACTRSTTVRMGRMSPALPAAGGPLVHTV